MNKTNPTSAIIIFVSILLVGVFQMIRLWQGRAKFTRPDRLAPLSTLNKKLASAQPASVLGLICIVSGMVFNFESTHSTHQMVRGVSDVLEYVMFLFGSSFFVCSITIWFTERPKALIPPALRNLDD